MEVSPQWLQILAALLILGAAALSTCGPFWVVRIF